MAKKYEPDRRGDPGKTTSERNGKARHRICCCRHEADALLEAKGSSRPHRICNTSSSITSQTRGFKRIISNLSNCVQQDATCLSIQSLLFSIPSSHSLCYSDRVGSEKEEIYRCVNVVCPSRYWKEEQDHDSCDPFTITCRLINFCLLDPRAMHWSLQLQSKKERKSKSRRGESTQWDVDGEKGKRKRFRNALSNGGENCFFLEEIFHSPLYLTLTLLIHGSHFRFLCQLHSK